MPTASAPTGIQNWISVKIAFSIPVSLTLVADVKAFMQSTITTGQQGLTPLGYIPLPSDFQTKVAAAINNIS